MNKHASHVGRQPFAGVSEGCRRAVVILVIAAVLTPHSVLKEVLPSAGEAFRTWWQDAGAACLRITDETSAWLIYLPSVLMLSFCAALRILFRQPPDWLRLPLALVFLMFQMVYLWFRATVTLSLETWLDAAASLLFLASEAFIHLRIALGNFCVLRITNRSREADESQRVVRSGEYAPAVDVLIPTYSEPVEMLRRTVIGCQAMDYPNKTIYLLDDQRRPAMRQLADELGCEYMDRPDNRHAKAGNLNHALRRSRGELIACFDADFVPCRDFLERTVGFFRSRKVAMVQTPQNFYNEDAITRNLGLEDALEDEQRLFFRTLQPARDAANAVVCHGTCFVARRTALEEIGGVPTETITEDWATSIKLQAAGYRICYLNEALSAGMSADRCGEFVQQRARWAQGTLQALFVSTNPLTIPGLNWKQRIIHFSGIIYYLGSLTALVHLTAPLLFLFFGAHLLKMSIGEMIFYRMPFMAGFYLLYSWLAGGMRSALWTEVYEAFLAPSMGFTVLRTVIRPFGRGFRVTDKTVRPGRLSLNRTVALPFLILMFLHAGGIAWSILAQRHIDEPDAFYIVLYFAIMNLALLWLCLLASMDVAQSNPHLCFARALLCGLTWEDTGLAGRMVSISEAGFEIARDSASPQFPRHAFAHLPEPGLMDVPVQLREKDGTTAKYEFLNLTLEQRRTLIEFLFCQPRQWERPARSEAKAAWEYVRAGLRMYPLAVSP